MLVGIKYFMQSGNNSILFMQIITVLRTLMPCSGIHRTSEIYVARYFTRNEFFSRCGSVSV